MKIGFYIRQLRKDLPRSIVFFIDLFITFSIFLFCSVLFHYNAGVSGIGNNFFDNTMPILIAYALGFLLLGTHKRVVRYTSLRDLFGVLKACLLGFFLATLFLLINPASQKLPTFFLFFIHFGATLLCLSFLRILYKQFYKNYVMLGKHKNRALIFGAGNLGVQTYSSIAGYYNAPFVIYGFIDDNINKAGKKIGGIPIFHTDAIDADFIHKHSITEIVFAVDLISSARMNELVEKFESLPVQLKRTPAFRQWLSSSLSPKMIKNIEIEDLLGRKPIKLEKSSIKREVRGKTILVTGAAGSIGSEIVRQLLNYPIRSLIMVDSAESSIYELQQTLKSLYSDLKHVDFIVADVRDYERMEILLNYHRPDFVYHAAAYKHVPLMEENPYEAIATNVKGTKNLVDLSIKYYVDKFIFVSTDKAVNPTNVMGATKRLSEIYISSKEPYNTHTKFITTRFGNVLGSNGSVVPLFKKQLMNGGPLLVTHKEITRYFMTIPEACQLVLEAGAMGKGGEIFVFDMGKSVKIFDLAKRMISLSGLRYPEDIEIEITGLRPGEKIYEELLANGENTMSTHHEKIMIAKTRPVEIMDLEQRIKELISTHIDEYSKEALLSLIKQIKDLVPEYISNNSIYECLDN